MYSPFPPVLVCGAYSQHPHSPRGFSMVGVLMCEVCSEGQVCLAGCGIPSGLRPASAEIAQCSTQIYPWLQAKHFKQRKVRASAPFSSRLISVSCVLSSFILDEAVLALWTVNLNIKATRTEIDSRAYRQLFLPAVSLVQ